MSHSTRGQRKTGNLIDVRRINRKCKHYGRHPDCMRCWEMLSNSWEAQWVNYLTGASKKRPLGAPR